VRIRFRTRVFIASLAVAAAALTLITVIVTRELQQEERASIERRLTDQATLIAEIVGHSPTLIAPAAIDGEADRLARSVEGRVTLIAHDGRVLGDSTLTADALRVLENHLQRPEVQQARRSGVAVVERYSTTGSRDMLYAAAPASHSSIGYVRVALPLTDVTQQLRRVAGGALLAFALAAPVAVALAWLTSLLVSRRVDAIAAVARRYSAGDISRPAGEYGSDELGAVARVLDATVQQLAQRLQELTRDRARMQAILTGMVEGVLVVDRQGRLQLANGAVQEMLSVDPASVGRSYLEVIRHPDIAAQLGAALRGQPLDGTELALTRDPGRTFVARATAVAGDGGGGAVLVLHEITHLRRADQIRRDFVANVSHELRTPLTAIRGYVEALLEGPEEPDEIRRFLEIINRHSARMERLVQDLLRLARLDAKQETLDRAPCDIVQLYDGVIADLAPAIADRGQTVDADVPPDLGPVLADPAKLHDVIRNLLENAVNYSPAGVRIRLSAERREAATVLTVTDSGPGIPAEDLTRVFERFYRVDKARSRPGGTGLGLAIVRHLVELHGGSVSAANSPSGGAVFTIELPRHPIPPAAGRR
jgi:two-component system phosphate regulon sensor histidine kinase PhoR